MPETEPTRARLLRVTRTLSAKLNILLLGAMVLIFALLGYLNVRLHRQHLEQNTLLSAERCHLGEGPTYDVTADTAWWFDIREGRLFEAHLGSGTIRIHALGRMASALGRIDAERQQGDGAVRKRLGDRDGRDLPRRRALLLRAGGQHK